MKKYSVFLFLILIGCASVDNSPSQYYRSSGSTEQMKISGRLDSDVGFINDTRILSVFVNNELALTGHLSESATGELSGKYQAHIVDAVCSSEKVITGEFTYSLDVKCMVLIDNERAATLTFLI